MSKEKLIVPVQVEQWIKELNDKKTHAFAKSLYIDRLESLRDYLNRVLMEHSFDRKL